MIDKLEAIKVRFDEVSKLIVDPDVISDMKKYIKLNKEYKDLDIIMSVYNNYKNIISNIDSAKKILIEEDDIELKEMAKTEIDLYKKEPILGREHDPCVWWKKKCDKYPLLSKLAKKYLCVPATSVESESVFSSLGLLLTKRRLSMTGDNVNRQLFKDKLLKQL